MPELPEVETIVRDLRNNITGYCIEAIKIYDQRVVASYEKIDLAKGLKGRRIVDISRRAKSIIISCEPTSYMVVQLRMTGQLIYKDNLSAGAEAKDTKVVFKLSNGRYLIYNDQRTLGWLMYAEDLSHIPYLQRVGKEPMDPSWDVNWLHERFKGRTSPIKSLLMNQQFVAGIGNIYASEILHQAGISPLKRAYQLSLSEIENLHKATQRVLRQAIRYRGTSMRNYRDAKGLEGKFNQRIKVYGRENQGCRQCGTMIQRIKQAGRSTYFCKVCQS